MTMRSRRAGVVAGLPFLLVLLLAAAVAPLRAEPARPPADISGVPTYLVFGPRDRMEPLPAGVEILGPSGHGTLVAGPPAAVDELAMRGLSLVRLARPLAAGEPVPRPAPPIPPRAQDFDPVIAQIVSRMSGAQIKATIQRLQDFGTRHTPTDSCRASAHYLHDRFTQMGYPAVFDTFDANGSIAYNVIAEKTGTVHPDEIYIICGHYDSISNQPGANAPGADDNASGTAAVVEAARVLADIDCEATIRFIGFSGEEQGLVGSRHYVLTKVVPQNDDVRGVLNLDMIAFVHPEYLEWDANWYADQTVSLALGQFVGECVQTYTTCTLHLINTQFPQYGSDHYFFAENGYPAVFDIDAQLWNAPDWNPNYHTTRDRIETLDLAYVNEMARGAVAALAELARPRGGTSVADPGAGSALPISALAVGPNPFRGAVVFDAGGRDLALEVVDATGRKVAALAGGGRLVWRGDDARGRQVAPGVYFYRVVDAAGTSRAGTTGRLVRVR